MPRSALASSRFVRALRDEAAGSERARLIAGMADALTAMTYTEVTVEAVVERAGLRRATFHQHFDDVEDCYLAAYATCGDLLRAQTTAAVLGSAGRPYEERIAAGVSAYLGTLAEEPGLARAFVRDVHRAGPEALRRRRAVLQQFAQMMVTLAEQHADELPPGYAVHPHMAIELAEAMEELVLLNLAEDRAQDLPRLTDTVTRLIHAALVVGD
ncbi:TetR/AcrR family transcriptional regulator [Baekduia sp. Peel2402]|uniref:TetR/AcrR family transcriptional regulator n=1 Tax=Baekduia sp. Peel2402 TaxID=3458296 RepID=UPI00403E450B